MKIDIIYVDGSSNKTETSYNISFLEFIKYLAIVGMSDKNTAIKFYRFISYTFEFASHWNNHNFSFPDIIMMDPTEKGQLSNRIGKALGAFMIRKIYGVSISTNYEYALKINNMSINGSRPDLYCFDKVSKKQFAIEVKGYSVKTVSEKKMLEIKKQSQQGALKVHFSIASVAYNLYTKPKIKFYDPVNSNTDYNHELTKKLEELYYTNISNLINNLGLIKSDFNEEFEKYLLYENKHIILYLIVKKSSKYLIKNDIKNNEEIFIDEDGIGIMKKVK